MPCVRTDPETMERFILDRLSQVEREAFERHLFECPACAEELATLEAIRAALRKVSAETTPRVRPRARWLVASVAVAAGAAAVAFGLWMLVERPSPVARRAPAPEPLPPPAQVQPERSPSTSPDLLALAEIVPPAYDPPVLRGSADEAERAFRAAMDPYRAGDYAAAAAALRSIASKAPADPRPAFYLGASRLLAGEIERGEATLEQVVALGDTPYLEDARLLLAKAHLRQGRRARAEAELRAVVALEGDREQEARGLLDALEGRP